MKLYSRTYNVSSSFTTTFKSKCKQNIINNLWITLEHASTLQQSATRTRKSQYHHEGIYVHEPCNIKSKHHIESLMKEET